MLILISPAKSLDFTSAPVTQQHSQPDFLERSEELINELITVSPDDLSALMKISPKLAELNVERYQQWHQPFTPKNAKQAVLAFQGDVYTGLNAADFSEDDFAYAQQHLRILSGLYGVLRPLDLMQAYRLEMGTKLANSKGKNLYEFWGSEITDALNQQLQKLDSSVIVNLASNEYFKSVKKAELNADIITPVFKDWKNGQYKMISFFAKKARGVMSAWIIRERINDIGQLKAFDLDGYQYDEAASDPLNPVFLRKT